MIKLSHLNYATRVMVPPETAHVPHSTRSVKSIVRNAMLGIIFSSVASASALADDLLQEWIPEFLALPGDAEVVMDRAIGSSIRMFSFTTEDDIDILFETWINALEENGYAIRPRQTELEDVSIEFSGRDILNAKIATQVGVDGALPVITFDATLR